MGKLIVQKYWNSEDVRSLCIRHRFYTCGDNVSLVSVVNLLGNKVIYRDYTLSGGEE